MSHRVLCDSSGDHTYVNISIKGARLSNEDAICSNGRLFGVFDGHGGDVAALLAKSEMPKEEEEEKRAGVYDGAG